MNLLDVIFPIKCLECGKGDNHFCSDCLNKVELAVPICPYCFRFSAQGKTHTECKRENGLERLIAVWKYQGVVRKAIIALKYKFVSSLALELADSFSAQLKKLKARIPKKAVLVPVPLYWKRLNWRGFNQTEEMGKYIARALKIRFIPDLIIKTVTTKAQAELKKEERLKNLKGVFAVNPEYKIKNKMRTVILFDDVWTTGSTIKEITRVLKEKGIGKIWGMTLVR